MVATLNDRVQNAIVAAVNNSTIPQVEMVIRSNQYGSSRAPESLVNKI